MDLDNQIGNFVCGKEFDALIIDPEVQNSPMCLFEEDSVTDIVEKFLYLGKYDVKGKQNIIKRV